jgi:hypothetical protein
MFCRWFKSTSEHVDHVRCFVWFQRWMAEAISAVHLALLRRNVKENSLRDCTQNPQHKLASEPHLEADILVRLLGCCDPHPTILDLCVAPIHHYAKTVLHTLLKQFLHFIGAAELILTCSDPFKLLCITSEGRSLIFAYQVARKELIFRFL